MIFFCTFLIVGAEAAAGTDAPQDFPMLVVAEVAKMLIYIYLKYEKFII